MLFMRARWDWPDDERHDEVEGTGERETGSARAYNAIATESIHAHGHGW